MVRRQRVSIGFLMAVVGCVAADFAIVRAFYYENDNWSDIALITLPMANVLLLVLPRMRRSRAGWIFWRGFEVAGWVSVALVVALGWFEEDFFFSPAFWVQQHSPFEPGSDQQNAFMITVGVIGYTIPQLVLVGFGGWLVSRYRVAIVRRSPTVSGGSIE